MMKSPRHIDIEITSRCNLRCKYCYYFNEPDHADTDLSTDTWKKFFKDLSALKILDITLAGGEPFIREDLEELLTSISDNKMRYSILSNGTLITDSIARFLAKNGHCDSVQVSLDGGAPKQHDVFRGTGAFKAAVNGIKTLQKYGVKVSLRLTLHHFNVKHISEAAEFILETLSLPQFSVNSAGYLGTCKIFSEDIQLTIEDRILAMITLLDLTMKYPGRISATAGPLAEARIWRSMIESESHGSPPSAGTLSGCRCFFTKLAVQSDGTIVPCNLMPQVKLGNFLHDSIGYIWLHSDALNSLRQRADIPLSQFELCRDCSYQNYCTGNCPGLSASITGDVNQPSPDACLKLFLESGGMVP